MSRLVILWYIRFMDTIWINQGRCSRHSATLTTPADEYFNENISYFFQIWSFFRLEDHVFFLINQGINVCCQFVSIMFFFSCFTFS